MTTSNKNMTIIGIAGTNGSGKDTVGEFLANQYGYMFITVSEMLRDELRKRGLPIERKYTSQLSAEWRREHGMGVLFEKALAMYRGQSKKYNGVVISNPRHPAEAKVIHDNNGVMVWVDADPRVRYERIQANKHRRNRAGEDDVAFEQFLADEKREMTPEGDDATLNMAGVKEMCDIFLENNGNDISKFEDDIKRTLGL